MSRYKIDKQDGAYFMTFTTVSWVDLSIRDAYIQFIADSRNFCVNERGLEIYSYVIMPSHIHLIAGAKENNLSTVVGSLKKFTSRELIKMIQDGGESRREWLLPIFREAGEKNPRNKKFQIWQQDSPACIAFGQAGIPKKFTLQNLL